MMLASVLAIYWLQPSTPVRNLDFWLPTASIVLTVFVWCTIRVTTGQNKRLTLAASLIVAGAVIAVGLTRYTEPLCCLTPTRPPPLSRITLVLSVSATLAALLYLFSRKSRLTPAIVITLILALFIIQKSEPLVLAASAQLRTWNAQSPALASAIDIPWLGFSYLAFRLLHVLRDHQAGKLPAYELNEFVVYGLFFPTYTAGPIDRSQRFVKDLRTPVSTISSDQSADKQFHAFRHRLPTENIIWGAQRILFGIFKKFVLADSLALIALNTQNASQVTAGPWLWVMIYAYALRIYFDFSGYTDIALGLGGMLGFRLPENFDRPYTRANLTSFWNSWHNTLAQWFRAYYFNPLTRFLRTRSVKIPTWILVLIGQTTTMLLIGLWHGITWNFTIWGLWHGVGLFVHNRWSTWIRPHTSNLDTRPRLVWLLRSSGWLLTFNYITLGWIWFALPTPALAWQVFQTLVKF